LAAGDSWAIEVANAGFKGVGNAGWVSFACSKASSEVVNLRGGNWRGSTSGLGIERCGVGTDLRGGSGRFGCWVSGTGRSTLCALSTGGGASLSTSSLSASVGWAEKLANTRLESVGDASWVAFTGSKAVIKGVFSWLCNGDGVASWNGVQWGCVSSDSGSARNE
jgi:hypothetical protein